jgi:predicted SAM-dependent methyltransferase
VDLQCDIRTGLPLETNSIDCIASIHVLQDLPYFDLDKALHAYLAGDSAYFNVPDTDVRTHR